MAEVSSPQVRSGTLPPEKTGPERVDWDPGDSYKPGDPVWVWSAKSRRWCPGTVDRASRIAPQVTYEPTGQRGTVADAVAPGYVARRSTGDGAGSAERGGGQPG